MLPSNRLIAAVLGLVALTVWIPTTSCDSQSGTDARDGPSPTAIPDAPTGRAPGAVGARSALITGKLDMNAIFPPGGGRDLVLNNCLACHGFVRFVLPRRTSDQWAYVRRAMGPRVGHLDERQLDTLFGYLERHFNETTTPPPLPEWFLDSHVW